jgi:hypothetical protein
MFGHQFFNLTSLKLPSLQCATIKQDIVIPLLQICPEPMSIWYREACLFSMEYLIGDPAAKSLLENIFCCEPMDFEITR